MALRSVHASSDAPSPRPHRAAPLAATYRASVYAGRDPLTSKQRYLRETAPTYEAAQKAAHTAPAPGRRGPAPEVRHHRPPGDRAVARGRRAGGHDPRALRGPDPALRPADVRAPPGREARRRAAGALLRPPAPLPRHVHRPPPRRPHLPPAEHQHDAQGPLHHPRRAGTRRPLAPPRREQGGDGRRAVPGAHRARPAQRRRGRAAAERRVERPGVGPAALADHAHRPAPRRDLSAALAAHRLRARPAVHRPQQRPAEGRR